MRLTRFNGNRMALLRDGVQLDVTGAMSGLPMQAWPGTREDTLIANLANLRTLIVQEANKDIRLKDADLRIDSAVANPGKIIAVPINYQDHVEEILHDPIMLAAMGGKIMPLDSYGLIIKANTSLAGPGVPLQLPFGERRIDHEIELAIVIGKKSRNLTEAQAPGAIAGYTIGLDITLRGTEERSLRKSLDGFTILGPCLVTADEVADPDNLAIRLSVNGDIRQSSSTSNMVQSVFRSVACASSYFTLLPGDVLLTGTPAGVGPLLAGDTIHAEIECIGSMTISVVGAEATTNRDTPAIA